MGSVVFSLDAELAWGFPDHDAPPLDRLNAARDAWRWLLDLFDEEDVPATWAVVGHLFLEDCDGVHETIDAPPEWFAHERERFADRPDLLFAPDLVDATRTADVDHDVGSHSLGHLLFDDDRFSRDALDADLASATTLADAAGVTFESFVFPRNRVDNRDVVADHDFRAYRGARRVPSPFLERAASKVRAFLDPSRVPLVEPTVDEYGMVEVPPSLYLFGFEALPRRLVSTLWTDPIVRLARDAIDRAAREDGVCHLWFHPNNVVVDRDRRRVRAIVEHAARRRDDSDLKIETLADVADRVLEPDWELRTPLA